MLPISELPIGARRHLASVLDRRHPEGKDWRRLASALQLEAVAATLLAEEREEEEKGKSGMLSSSSSSSSSMSTMKRKSGGGGREEKMSNADRGGFSMSTGNHGESMSSDIEQGQHP